ncbi:phytanoyl-CoA dioxygenase family protein [Marinoscillum furvescens]|uniref:Phytanoyl-CoA dioxygenase PhyH n=1 Tax=Marinoscillum furvescens DSM 4134 TaxID=1122208 RepID=A0A3D9KYK6_MARFU|nr:phytanoyl-CoA dioxygenase family protein [Marinoscillum furvescens]RED92311.1 phytanoyl-CoA dioxygenase PhyH [Marinoscillum furvescens DSM 4134]
METQVKQLFLNPKLDKAFKELGVIKIGLLDKDELMELLQFASKNLQNQRPVIDFAKGLNYYISIFDTDEAFKRACDQLISGIVNEKLSKILVDYESFYSNFMIKYPGDGVLECHQDFNLVDERNFTGFNLWCPLSDTAPENGGLHFIKGSHRVKNLFRGPNLPFSFTRFNEVLIPKAQPVTVNAGECLIFDHRTIHFSTPNTTTQTRYAIQSVLKPIEAPSLLYIYDATEDAVHAKEIDREYTLKHGFWSEEIMNRPTLHTIDYENPEELDDVQNLVSQ